MSSSRLTPPQRLDVIPAAEVGALIEQTDRDFVVLERQLQEARAEAAETEAVAAAEGIDPKSSTWTMVRLQRFLDGLRDEARRDASATVQVAQQRAKARIGEARDEAERRRQGHDPDPLVPPVRAPDLPSGPAPMPSTAAPDVAPPAGDHGGLQALHVAAGAAVVGGVAIAMQKVAPAPPARQVPAAQAATSQFAPPAHAAASSAVAPSPGGEPGATIDEFWGPATADPDVVAEAPLAVVPAMAAPSAPAPTSVPAAEVAAVAPESAAFAALKAHEQTRTAPAPNAARAPERAKPGLLKRIPITAILEVLAVLGILVFILLRLS